MRTRVSPSGTLRSSCCCASAAFNCSSVTMPSDTSAWPMRTIGMRLCAAISFNSCSGVTTSADGMVSNSCSVGAGDSEAPPARLSAENWNVLRPAALAP